MVSLSKEDTEAQDRLCRTMSIGGWFGNIGGQTRSYMARLNADRAVFALQYRLLYQARWKILGGDCNASTSLVESVKQFNNAGPDTTPDAFNFTSQTGVAVNSAITSNAITVSGINTAAPISISVCAGTLCQYSVNGGSYHYCFRYGQ